MRKLDLLSTVLLSPGRFLPVSFGSAQPALNSLASNGDEASDGAQWSHDILNIHDIDVSSYRPQFPSRGVLLADDLLAHANFHDLLPPLDQACSLGLCWRDS